MNSRSLATIAGTALVTAALALIALRPSFVHAVTDSNSLSDIIETPKLKRGGVEVTLVCVEYSLCREGTEPLFKLTAVNTAAQPALIRLNSNIRVVTRPNPRSRTLVIPKTFWQEVTTLALGPHETRDFTLKVPALPANSALEVFLREASEPEIIAVRMLSFSTRDEKGPAAESILLLGR